MSEYQTYLATKKVVHDLRVERDRLAARVAELEAELAAVRAAVTKAAMTPSGRAATYIAQALEALGMGLHPRGQVADREMRRAAESPDRSEQ
jgi:hypothetical protein